VKLALLALLAGAIMTAPADHVAQIRTARAAYNAAIIARDTAGVRAAFVDDYKGIAGSGGELIAGGDAMAAYFARAFATSDFISFVRTPDVITVAVPADRAMERGHWLGRRKTAAGEAQLHGEYLAVWVHAIGGWRLRSESFVTLSQSEIIKDSPQGDVPAR
jgi:ketosteroid isomerase-like protein